MAKKRHDKQKKFTLDSIYRGATKFPNPADKERSVKIESDKFKSMTDPKSIFGDNK